MLKIIIGKYSDGNEEMWVSVENAIETHISWFLSLYFGQVFRFRVAVRLVSPQLNLFISENIHRGRQ